jgi:putative membrane protein
VKEAIEVACAGSLAAPVAVLVHPVVVWGQERTWEGRWEIPIFWWPLILVAGALVLLVLAGWAFLQLIPTVLALVAAVLGIRWLARTTGTSRHRDRAVELLRERYARGEIGKDEFDAKLRDLGGSP